MEHAKGISPRLGDKRAKQKSAFARTSAFANYKLSAFADYSRPLLLAPRQLGFQPAFKSLPHIVGSVAYQLA
jgi:hypothetical protein